jgi:hypothetical protein
MNKPRIESDPPACARVGYPLRAEHPGSAEVIDESCATIRGAIARATELANAGYSVEIGGPASRSKN